MADPATLSKLLHVAVILFQAAGVYLITRGGPVQAGVGVILVIFGLIGLMPALGFYLDASEPAAGK